MVSQHGNKFPPSVYELAEKVLVKMKISDGKIREKNKTFGIIKGKKLTERKHAMT